MSLIEIARLSAATAGRSSRAYGERWVAAARGHHAGDRKAAEDGVVKAYAAAGLPPPRDIVWAGGPFEIANAWARSRGAAGDNVRSLVVDLVCRKAEAAVDRAVGLAVRVSLAGEPRLARVPPFCSSIDEAVLRDCERVRPRLRARLAGLFAPPQARLAELRCEQLQLAFGPVAGPARVLSRRVRPAAPDGGAHAGSGRSPAMPRGSSRISDVCWLAERPRLVRHDASGRLHCRRRPGGRATATAGRPTPGRACWCPRWIIERPDLVTVRTVASAQDPQIRRCMIDILTPERFIAGGGAYRVAQDETGVLWRQRWRWEAWAAVEVVNGTPEPDGTSKHYFLQVPANMRSAREAVAWTYGLPEQRYRPARAHLKSARVSRRLPIELSPSWRRGV